MSDKQAAPSLPPLIGGGGNNGSATQQQQQQTVRLQQVLATAQGLNVLTTGGGQQFVITSQVPGLAQVIPGSITTNAGVQQVGVTRIVNISSSPRVSVVGVAGASSSPTRQSPAKVVVSTSPKLVRNPSTGNVFVAPTAQTTIQSPPARKRLRLSESAEKVTTIDDSLGYRRRIMEHKMKRMRAIREKYAENASELFFLHAGGNMMDFQNWRKRPSTPQYLQFLRQHRLDPEDDDEDLTQPLTVITDVQTTTTTTTATSATVVPNVSLTGSSQATEVKFPGAGVTPVAVSTTLPAAVAKLNQQGGTPIVQEPPKPLPVVPSSPVAEKIPAAGTSAKPTTKPPTNLIAPQPVVKLVKLPNSTIVSSCDAANNQEQIVEKAKQEAYVMQRISELQREGLWSERRLPKVQEPSRTKAHWDYLLEEMVWLAADFAQERKWKKAAAKKCARMVQKHFQEKAVQAQKAEKSQELRLKKIAGFVAKEIKTFWTNVEKLVEYKQQTRLEEKRKKALDQHLNFIVGQTEKYSTWLTEGLNKTDGVPSVSASMNSSRISSPVTTGKNHSDDEFEPNQSSDDDEETIAKAEEEMKSTTNHMEEVEMLKRESELPLEDLLKELPPNYLEERDKSLSPSPEEDEKDADSKLVDGDEEFVAATDESSDDEDTIMEQEKLEFNQDHKQELNDLNAENEMSIDELMAKYSNMVDAPMDVDEETDGESSKASTKDQEDEKDEESDYESESEDETKDDEDSQTQSDEETNVGLKSLLEDLSVDKSNDKSGAVESLDQSDQARNEMDDVAALAESIQPKGNTLLTTSVVTKIPFLLKHSLREYQHIGLDWLVTMFERKLNGILADEMGLGKTIQTIALLAHLACEKGNWGPHLIIVPTSVMLNWEMECKKWCPGFKILTYYGTQKERKLKRTGWTKPNAFHICITSYKLVIQDHQSFRRKKWKYLILDEAQNIKNFKSQRWQLLLNFQTQRRLLLTGTPLQNNLMELWSLMHFLMPNVFQSHREFKEWFSNPVTGMIEGNSEYNENIIRRLHKVLRPFLLRRLKTEVEKQLPKKYEHVVMCRLSKRQRYLYDDFMSRAKTRETLASGNLLSVINVLMQLRKVCNHPNLFEVRPTVSPFQMEGINFVTASLAWSALDYDPFRHVDLSCLNLFLVDLELTLSAFVAHRVRQNQTPRKLIEEIDSQPEVPPRCPSGKIKINVRLSNQSKPPAVTSQPNVTNATPTKLKNLTGILPTPKVGTSPLIKGLNNQTPSGQGVTLRVATGQQLQGYSVQLVQHQGSVKAIPVATLAHTQQTTVTSTPTTAAITPQRITVGNANIKDSLQRLTTQTVTVKQGDSVQRIAVPGFAQLVQTSTGRHLILTSNQQNTNTVSFPVMTSGGQRLTVLSKSLMGLTTSVSTVNRVMPAGVVTTTTPATSGRPIMRVPPLSLSQGTTAVQAQQQQIRCGFVTRNCQTAVDKNQIKEIPKSEFYLPQIEEERRQRRQSKLQTIGNVNERRCAACPLYGEDLFDALRIDKPVKNCCWHGEGWVHCNGSQKNARTRREFFSRTEALAEAIKSTELIVEQLQEVFERFVVYVPAVRAPMPKFHVSHPPPHKLWAHQRLKIELQHELSPKLTLFHPVASAMSTQFPDPRLIQYDCGKLQSLDRLLRNLKTGSHRVLIFTQMTRMLDVLEAFLNFHGHIYLRLDGATKVDQRQVLMERFNGDKRIFCFILSTRSGGVGVNLTGADTVIFYDSDWNPTMDAQAQDRCHRIGQTRDVHIYRLVSEKTVEENILKKANQKRLLGDLAIEGGNFTTAYFKSSTIQDLFNVDQAENDASARMAEVLERSKDREKIIHQREPATPVLQPLPPPSEEKVAMGALESALAAAEEDLDVQAAKTAKAEAVADLAEFDENIPLDDPEKEDTQVSKAEQEVQHLVQQLSPIERYAMKFVEESEGSFSAAQLAAAERELEQQKKEWELGRLRALREEEERRMRLADDEEKPLTFGREDAQNQVNNTSNSKKLVNKRTKPSRRSERSRVSHSVTRESSESETETTTSESESQEDQVEDSPDEESSHTESQSQEDEEDDEEAGRGSRLNESKGSGPSRSRNKSNRSTGKSRWDLNSPRTRSRGNVKINLWTLDVRPILPGLRPVHSHGRGPKKRGRPRSDEIFMPPPTGDTVSKKTNAVSPINSFHRRPDTPLPNSNKKAAKSNGLDKKSQPVKSTLIFNIESDSSNVDEGVSNSQTDGEMDSSLDKLEGDESLPSPLSASLESKCDEEIDGTESRGDENLVNVTNKDPEKFPVRRVSAERENAELCSRMNSVSDSSSESETIPSTDTISVKNSSQTETCLDSIKNAVDDDPETVESKPNSNFQSNNSTIPPTSDSDSKTRSLKPVVKSSRPFSPALITRSSRLSRPDLDPIEVSNPDTREEGTKSCENDSQIGKPAAPLRQKSNLNSVSKSKTLRPDTPFPGPKTRNKSMTLNANDNTQSNNEDTRRVTRSGLISSAKSVTKIGRSQRPDTPFPASDLGRVTRSGISRPITPLPLKIQQKSAKSTSLQNLKPPDVLITRNTRSINSSSKTNSTLSKEPSGGKFSKPSSNEVPKFDDEFQVPNLCIRKCKSTPSMKVTADTNPLVNRRKVQSINDGKINAFHRRPDTPLPASARSIRVTRSTANSDSVPQACNFVLPTIICSRIKKPGVDSASSDSNHRPEIIDSNLNSDPSSSTQVPRPKLNRRTLNTDSNANAVDSVIRIPISKSRADATNNLRKTVPDSTTKSLENAGTKSLSEKTDSIDLPAPTLDLESREMPESIELGTSYHFTELNIKERAQQILSKSKFRLSTKSLSFPGDTRPANDRRDENRHSNANADDHAFDSPPVLQRMNTYSNNPCIPKAFVRVSKLGTGRLGGVVTGKKLTSHNSKQNSAEQLLESDKIPRVSESVSDQTDDQERGDNDRQSMVPADSTVVTYIDLDKEPEYMPPPKKYRKKKRLTTRISPLTNSSIDKNKKQTSDIEIVDIVDDEQKRSQSRFNKRLSHHIKSPTASGKSNNGPVS